VIRDDLIAYLSTTFDADAMLHNTREMDAEYRIGYITGIREIINHLKSLQE
jgi:hypothetical protein